MNKENLRFIINKLFSFFSLQCFLTEIENMFSVFLSSFRNTCESLGELEKAKGRAQSLYSHDWLRNLQLEQVRHARNLRSSSTINLFIPHASDTFQHSAAALFNSLPSNVKGCDNFKSFSKQTLCILREHCRNRAE